jgi:transposase
VGGSYQQKSDFFVKEFDQFAVVMDTEANRKAANMSALNSRAPGAETARFSPESHQPAAHRHSVAHTIESMTRSLANDLIHPVNCEDGMPMDSRMLLALLGCCYACQIYRSEDVAAAVRKDVTFRERCSGAAPDARTIRRFRRKNRAPLHACLVAGLRVLAQQKLEAGVISRICEANLEEEARRRIIMAMFMDRMDLNRDRRATLQPR